VLAKLILLNVPSKNPESTVRFYSALMGYDGFARSLTEELEAYHMPISVDGIDLSVGQRRDDQEPITAWFAVDSVRATIAQLEDLGARVVTEPFAVQFSPRMRAIYEEAIEVCAAGEEVFERPVRPRARTVSVEVTDSVGQAAIIRDPEGNLLGIIEPAEHTHAHFAWGKYRKPQSEGLLQYHMTAIKAGQRAFGPTPYDPRSADERRREERYDRG
jgi:predicted enzyme related to lactoylglutathione lyase